MRCLICLEAETADGRTSVIFARDEFRLRVDGVPARICPACGEAYVEEEVAQELLSLAERESTLGVREAVFNFGG